MGRNKTYCALVLVLALLSGCASTIPEDTVPTDTVERITPDLAVREAYQLAKVSTQETEDGSVIDVAGICSVTVKGFGYGKTITVDGQTCAGAKNGETLVWVTCDYVNLAQNEVSPGRLIDNGTLQLDGGISVGKSASFSQILPGKTVEVYFYYAVPEDLPEQPLNLQFTVGGQAYGYEVPADRSGALPPTLPETETAEDEEAPDEEDAGSATLQQTPAKEQAKQEDAESGKENSAGSGSTSSERKPNKDGGYTIFEYDAAGRVIKASAYNANDQYAYGYTNEYDPAGFVSKLTTYGADGKTIIETFEFENGKRIWWHIRAEGNNQDINDIYDDAGRLKESRSYDPADGSLIWTHSYEYRADGSYLIHYSSGSDPSLMTFECTASGEYIKRYDYDWDGNLISVKRSENGVWVDDTD